MKNYGITGVYLYETEMFKAWMQQKGYKWPPSDPAKQQNMMSEFQKEGLEMARVDKEQKDAGAE